MGLFAELKVKVGMRVEIVLNESTADGLCNGADGILRAVTSPTEHGNPTLVWIEFDDERVGRRMRAAMETVRQRNRFNVKWTPISAVQRTVAFGRSQNAQFIRVQLPIAPSNARTVNRSQGMTMEKVCCDFRGRAGSGKHYVGLSRVTSLDGLYIPFGALCPDRMQTSCEVKQQMTYLREYGRMPLSVVPISNLVSQGEFVIMAQNVVSWRAHRDDVLATQDFRAAHVLICGETRNLHTDDECNVDMPGYDSIRVDCNVATSRKIRARGLCTYSKQPIVHAMVMSMDCMQASTFQVSTRHGMLTVISVYRSPQSSVSTMEHVLGVLLPPTDSMFVVMGDMNMDPKATVLTNLFSPKGAKQLIAHGTRHDNVLDHVWTNIPERYITSGTVPCYFSDHASVFITLSDSLVT